MRDTNLEQRYLADGRYDDLSLDDIPTDIAADSVTEALKVLGGRWKMRILFHLAHAPAALRFSELERAIPDASQKMLIQQLRELERDGVVKRTVYPQVPPRVEYDLTDVTQALCPALEALFKWEGMRKAAVRHTAIATEHGDAAGLEATP